MNTLMASHVWDENTYAIQQRHLPHRWSLEWISNVISHVMMECNNLSMMEFKLTQVVKDAPWMNLGD